MTGSWICSIIILIARVITAVDFVLLRVKIYSIPTDVEQRNLLFKKMGVKKINRSVKTINSSKKSVKSSPKLKRKAD